MQVEHEPMIPEMDNEDLIAQYQKRIRGAACVQEGMEITARFSDACRNSEAIPAWVLVIRAMAARIHQYKAVEQRSENRHQS